MSSTVRATVDTQQPGARYAGVLDRCHPAVGGTAGPDSVGGHRDCLNTAESVTGRDWTLDLVRSLSA